MFVRIIFLGAISQKPRSLGPDLPRIMEEAKAAVLRFVIPPQVIMGRFAGYIIGMAEGHILLNIRSMQVRRNAQAL